MPKTEIPEMRRPTIQFTCHTFKISRYLILLLFMNQNAGITRSKFYFEIFAYAIAVLVAIVMLIPLYNNTLNYSFFLNNFLFIFLFITFTRYIFFLRFSIFSHITIAKLIFIFSTIPLAFLLTDAFSAFQEYADTVGLQEFVKHLEADKQVQQ